MIENSLRQCAQCLLRMSKTLGHPGTL
jgi:hypothetical protein